MLYTECSIKGELMRYPLLLLPYLALTLTGCGNNTPAPVPVPVASEGFSSVPPPLPPSAPLVLAPSATPNVAPRQEWEEQRDRHNIAVARNEKRQEAADAQVQPQQDSKQQQFDNERANLQAESIVRRMQNPPPRVFIVEDD